MDERTVHSSCSKQCWGKTNASFLLEELSVFQPLTINGWRCQKAWVLFPPRLGFQSSTGASLSESGGEQGSACSQKAQGSPAEHRPALCSSAEKIQKPRAHIFSGWILPRLNFLKMFSSLRILYRRPPFKSESESRSVVSDSLCPHGLYRPWNSPGQNTGVGSLSLLQGIFPTQGSKPGLPHCRQILYQLSHKGSPRILEWVAYPFSGRSS